VAPVPANLSGFVNCIWKHILAAPPGAPAAGRKRGLTDTTSKDSTSVGTLVGWLVGTLVGWLVGTSLGAEVGLWVGETVGAAVVGDAVGMPVVGLLVGACVSETHTGSDAA